LNLAFEGRGPQAARLAAAIGRLRLHGSLMLFGTGKDGES
jgi:hypothetical protein